jgi:deoxyribonuclease-4
LNLEESDFLFDEWIQALKDFDVRGMMICESPEQDKDALMLKNLYYE